NACTPDDKWPRKNIRGDGVEGIRLYMETGAYVSTDEDGLYHFEDVEAGVHVVQIDTTTIPDGYEIVACEENTRYAGSAISKFVDAQGGSIWRANFYLKGENENKSTHSDNQFAQSDAREYTQYDIAWLDGQSPDPAWAYPTLGSNPTSRSINLGIKHPAGQRVALLLNGSKAPALNFAGREVNKARSAAISRWRGLDLVDGENHLIAIIQTMDGTEISRLERTFVFVSDAAQATLAPAQSNLVADGTTSPVIAVRMTDGAGRVVKAGQIFDVEIAPPYRAKDLNKLEDTIPLTEPLTTKSSFAVGRDGILAVELEPTLQTGNARITVYLDEQRSETFVAYLKPQLREWIIIGLAEGSAQHQKNKPGSAGSTARKMMERGRVAVFAKGTVKGGWLVTAAVDTDKGRGDEDDALFDDIDPDARYSVYGDRSIQQFEAQSRYPVYFKAEKSGFQALFGDYDTGLSETKLGRYSRRLSGFQSTYEGERFRFTGFAAETNQVFMRDEIAADGTSGPFNLTTAPLVRNSETIYVETRNRFRPDEVVATAKFVRYFDYDIDFRTGEVIFRLPVPAATDPEHFNVIVAEYETSAPVHRNAVGGGRGAILFADGRIETGVTLIHEDGAPGVVESTNQLAAIDLRADVTDTTRLRLEYGVSKSRIDGDSESFDAISAEIKHVSEGISARAYYDDVKSGFGLSQQSSGVSGVRRYGIEANVRLDQFNSAASGARGERYLDAAVYREENLRTGANRSVSEIAIRQEAEAASGKAGFRRVVENTFGGERRKSLLATAEVRKTFKKIGLTLRAARDQAIDGRNDSSLFPQRTVFGFDQKLSNRVTLSASHEIQNGDDTKATSTIVGVAAEPWTGARITASADKLTQDSGRRLGATFGLDQQVQLNDKWSASFGVSRREELANDGSVTPLEDIVSDDPLSPLENNADFTSGYIGAGYRSEKSQGSARVEMKKSALSDRYTIAAAAAREVSEKLSFAGAARIEETDNQDQPDEHRIDARVGFALRPRDDDLVIFNRFDIKQHKIDGELYNWKAINNLAVNAMLNERWQLSINHGLKYSFLETDGAEFSGYTQLFGLETRFDVTKKIDFGFRGTMLYSHNAGTIDYSYGPSLGVNPADNVWLGAGWNFAGFVDDDFIGAEYTRNGPFIQLRIKFDQNTAAGLLNSISPSAN
ncbi:MAG: hypothetical protein HKP25_05400, partial [Marinicaulis sp.]|nr:hypothetical protein [Marinicaulis sp.]